MKPVIKIFSMLAAIAFYCTATAQVYTENSSYSMSSGVNKDSLQRAKEAQNVTVISRTTVTPAQNVNENNTGSNTNASAQAADANTAEADNTTAETGDTTTGTAKESDCSCGNSNYGWLGLLGLLGLAGLIKRNNG